MLMKDGLMAQANREAPTLTFTTGQERIAKPTSVTSLAATFTPDNKMEVTALLLLGLHLICVWLPLVLALKAQDRPEREE